MKNNHVVRNVTAPALSVMASLAIATLAWAALAQEEAGAPEPPANPGQPDLPTPKGVPGTPKPLAPAREPRAAQYGARVGDKPMYADRLRAVVGPADEQTLIVPKDGGDSKRGGEADMEDMVVMEHILEKALAGRDEGKQAMGILIRGQYGVMGSTRNLYIEGYGALFFMNVNFPLLPPPVAKETEPKNSSNAEWDEARRELRHESEPFALNWADAGGPRSYFGEDYAAEKVEAVKRNVLIALKNAAHIRPLKPDETVTVVVTGRGPNPARVDRKKFGSADSAELGTERAEAESKTARLLVRARKSDADAFLRDELSFEEFRKKATVFIY